MTFKRKSVEIANNFTMAEKEPVHKQDTDDGIEGQIVIKNPSKFQMCKIWTRLVFGAIVFLLGILSFKYTLFELFMQERIRMTPGFPPFEWWLKPKPQIFCRVHLFTIENSEEFLNGEDEKLKIKDVGPINYREKITHFDPEFHDNSTLSYTIKREVEFIPEMNEPGILNRTVIVPNIILLNMIAIMNSYSLPVKIPFNWISKKDPVFLNTTIYNYLWNLTTPTLRTIRKYVPFMVPQDNGGTLHTIYEHFEDRVNVRIGSKHGFSEFFMINTYAGRPTVPGYRPERGDCYNSVENSTEGALYPNYLTKDKILYYWRKTVCKAVPLYFEKEVYKTSILAYKYVARPDMYDRLENLTADCNKMTGGRYLPNGLSDASKCYHDLPIAMSSPHFYGRQGYWDDKLDGFTPSYENHHSFTILEPLTGVPIEQKARAQSNLIMPKLYNFIPDAMKFSEMVIPMLWIEYHQESLTSEIFGLLIFQVNILPYLQYVIAVITIIAGLLYIHNGVKRLKTALYLKNFTLLNKELNLELNEKK